MGLSNPQCLRNKHAPVQSHAKLSVLYGRGCSIVKSPQWRTWDESKMIYTAQNR